MIINYVREQDPDRTIFESEERGYVSLVLVAVRYVGDQSSVSPTQMINDAAWPHRSAFQGGPKDPDGSGRLPGPPKGALIADWVDESGENRTIEAIESNSDFEVIYRPERIARAMLEANYLDPKVFNPGASGFNPQLRERVFDQLGLTGGGAIYDEAEYRAQLREIAGVEADADQIRAETRDDSRVTEYRQTHDRDTLVDAATILGMDRDDAEGKGKIELATWLADHDAQAARFALEGKTQAARDVLEGDAPDPADADPLTAADVVAQYEYDEIKTVVKAAREGTGEFSLRGADVDSMAEFLVDQKGLTEDGIDAHLTE